MTLVSGAVAAIVPAVRWIRVTRTRIDRRVADVQVADASGQRGMRSDGDAVNRTPLNVQQQAMIIRRSSVFEQIYRAECKAVCRSFDGEPAALLEIGIRGARSIGDAVNGARRLWKVDSLVQRLQRPHVMRRIADVARRCVPVRTNLALNGEVPRLNVRSLRVVIHGNERAVGSE